MVNERIYFSLPDMLRDLGVAWLDWRHASDKGYPKLMDKPIWFVMTDDDGRLIGYTTATEIEDCIYVVGNTFVSPEHRNSGFHSKLLSFRNDKLKAFGGTTIYTLLNPQGITTPQQLRHVVSKLGYKKAKYRDMRTDTLRIRDILLLKLSRLEIWRKDL